jgi:two-component system CheB/CheR fusion protein
LTDGANEREPEFEALITYLAENRGFDFGGYKRSSLRRRITKRMQDVGADDFAGYREYLEANPKEFQALFNTILINVTDFFRDKEAWTVLRETVIPTVLGNWAGHRQLRVWSAGCASGQEPYSLAMLLAEALGEERFQDAVRVYATDVDEEALHAARAGRYTNSEVEAVPAKLLRKYFDRDNDHFVFRRDLRKTMIFGRHNLVTDAPISRVDLLLCRNVLIYLDLKTQRLVLPRLHYALAPNGVLFLGKAETLLARSPLFKAIDAKHRLFAKIGTVPQRGDLPAWGASVVAIPELEEDEAPLASLLSTLPSAHILLDAKDYVMFISGAAARWFQLSPRDVGRPFQDLDVSFRPIELRRLVQEARDTLSPQRRDKLRWRAPSGEDVWIQAEVLPVLSQTGQIRGTAINIFDVSQLEQLSKELQESSENLETMTEELQSSNEELETTNEELQSTNEELETTNEELQSTNEELETTNEELRSANEELGETNEELGVRTAELEAYRNSMERMLAGIRFGVIGLDAQDKVAYWNAESEDMWGLRADEAIGHSIHDLDTNMPVADFTKQIDAVRRGQQPRNHAEFRTRDRRGRMMDCRILITPLLQVGEKEPDGTLLLVEDITERKQHAREVEMAREYAEKLIQTLREPILLLDEKLEVVSVNRPFRKAFAVTAEEAVGTSIFELACGAWNIPELRELLERVIPENAEVNDFCVEHAFAGLGMRKLLLNGHRIDLDDGPTHRVLLAIEDVTDRPTPPEAKAAG